MRTQEFRKSVLTWLMQHTSSRMMRWIVCIIIKDLKARTAVWLRHEAALPLSNDDERV